MRNLQEQVKKHSVTKNCSDLSLFEQIVLVISKFLQIIGLQIFLSYFATENGIKHNLIKSRKYMIFEVILPQNLNTI